MLLSKEILTERSYLEQLNEQLDHIVVKRVVTVPSVDAGLPMATVYWWPKNWESREVDPYITATIVPYSDGKNDWNVLEISSQKGCLAQCKMCGIPALRTVLEGKTKLVKDLPKAALLEQITALRLLKSQLGIGTEALDKILLTDGGESLQRADFPVVIESILKDINNTQIKVSTVGIDTPTSQINTKYLMEKIRRGAHICLQWSVMATNEAKRRSISRVKLLSLKGINEKAAEYLRITGHRLTLSFTVMDVQNINLEELRQAVDPSNVVVRVHYAKQNGVQHITGFTSPIVYQLNTLVKEIRSVGYHVEYHEPDTATMERLNSTGTLSHVSEDQIKNLAQGWK